MTILDIYEQQALKQKLMNPPFDLPNKECHKKKFFDLESIQVKLGITQKDVDTAWSTRMAGEPVYLCYSEKLDRHFWISNYE